MLTTLKYTLPALVIGLLIAADHASADRREGRISWKRCPHSCATEKINKKDCRDWRQGDICMVEDLTKPRQSGVREDTDGKLGENEYPGPNTFRNQDSFTRPPQSPTPWATSTPTWGQNNNYPTQCSGENLRFIRAPRIDVYDLRSRGNLFGDKYRVRGTIEGTCISEAGYFEDGRLVEKIPVNTTPEFKRYEFEVNIRGDSSRDPEIRAYSANGEREEVELSRMVEKEFGSDSRGGW